MSKKNLLRVLGLTAGSIITIVSFQNCGNGALEATQFVDEMSSQSALSVNTLTQNHHDLEVDDLPTVVEKTENKTDFDLIMSDRFYTKSVLERVFGPQTRTVDTQNFEVNPLEFGSICSTYEQYRVRNTNGTYAATGTDAMHNCALSSATNQLGANWNPKPTVVRAAMLSKTCSELVMNNTTLSFALKAFSTEAIPAPTSANMSKLFMLFYQGKPAPHQGLIDSLLVMMDPSNMSKDSWKAPIYTICASPHWQVM